MPLTEAQLARLIRSTSTGAIAYQAHALIRDLRRINEEEFSPEAVALRNVLICWPEYILEEIWKIHQKEPLGSVGSDGVRVRSFAQVLHQLYSYIQYLTASTPRQAPPAIQAALNQLKDTYFPTSIGEAVCVIQPQWQYNLEYVPLSIYLRRLIPPSALDPSGAVLGTPSPAELSSVLWAWRRQGLARKAADGDENAKVELEKLAKEAPQNLAVLSFAGLDTHDALLYPILAHELGHFIDYSFEPPLNRTSAIVQAAEITLPTILEVIRKFAPHLETEAPRIWENAVTDVAICVRELLADLLALRMMGFGFFAAQSEFLKTIAVWPERLVIEGGYPGIKFRLWSILRHLVQPTFPANILAFLQQNQANATCDLTTVTSYLNGWMERVRFGATIEDAPGEIDPLAEPNHFAAIQALTQNAVLRSLAEINAVAVKTIPDGKCPTLSTRFFERVHRLEHDLPPTPSEEIPGCFAELLAAGWAYQLWRGEEREAKFDGSDRQFGEYEKTCRLLMKSIELIPTKPEEHSGPKRPISQEPESGAVLSAPHIWRRTQLPPEHPEHLCVVPLKPKSIEASSVDVRLGSWFITMRKTRLTSVKLSHPAEERLLQTVGREQTFVPRNKSFLIHPGDLVLGATEEFLALPNDLMAFVEGKSRLGRLGLIVATASQIGPGFHGVVVLELVNAGTVPLELVPGMAVAQLVFQKMSGPTDPYRGKFYCQINP